MTIRYRRRWYIVSTRKKDDSAHPKKKPRSRAKARKRNRCKIKRRSHRR